MRKSILLITFTLLTLLVSAQDLCNRDKLEIASRLQLMNIKKGKQNKVASEQPHFLPSIIKLNEGQDPATLQEYGVKLLHRRDNLQLAFIPIDSLDKILSLSCLSRMSFNQTASPTMNKARPFNNVTAASEPSTTYPNGWDGRGVVVGFCDIGFDPNHINFIDPDGKSRVKKLVNYKDLLGTVNIISSPDAISSWETDNNTEWHATHVAGILAGGYKDNSYQGVATAAEIVATTSELYDACILDGAEEIIEYAKSQGKPAVINMSIGSYTGPHDGTTLFNQYLDKLGKEAIICMAAGNEGHRTNTLQLHFTDKSPSFSTFIQDCKWWNSQRIMGEADYWSDNATPFEVRFLIYDRYTGKIVIEYPFVGNGEETIWEIASPDFSTESTLDDDTFNSCFNGYFTISSGIDPENGRYRIYSSFDVTNHESKDLVGRHYIATTIKADNGTNVNAYTNGSTCYFTSSGRSDFITGNANMSISDIACGKNIIAVGAATSRDTYPLLDGTTKTTGYTINKVGNFTGFGTLADGRSLPHICAAGCTVISSCSTPFIKSSPTAISSMSAKATVDGKDYYWIGEPGTSMATPMVAGIIAQWLQANPNLTVDEAREIAMSTAMTNFSDITDPRWGAGNIDALAGLKKVIENSGIHGIYSDIAQPITMRNGSQLIITHPHAKKFTSRLHSIDGREVANQKSADGSLTLDLSTLPRGYYILSTLPATKPTIIHH